MSFPIDSDFIYQATDFDELKQQFSQTRNWQEKYRLIMLLGKNLPSLDEAYRTESARVDGCESAAWLYHLEVESKHYYLADSDTRIVKGLIAILLSLFHGKTTAEAVKISVAHTFEELGLTQQLSPSRTNGLLALAKQIQHYLKYC